MSDTIISVELLSKRYRLGQIGATSLRDTAMVCQPCHHDLHVGKKTLRLRDGRWLDENGWTDGPGRQ